MWRAKRAMFGRPVYIGGTGLFFLDFPTFFLKILTIFLGDFPGGGGLGQSLSMDGVQSTVQEIGISGEPNSSSLIKPKLSRNKFVVTATLYSKATRLCQESSRRTQTSSSGQGHVVLYGLYRYRQRCGSSTRYFSCFLCKSHILIIKVIVCHI